VVAIIGVRKILICDIDWAWKKNPVQTNVCLNNEDKKELYLLTKV
jgi:hypothetical protein